LAIIRKTSKAIIGVSDHGGWAILVTSNAHGTLLDRRRVELVDASLPKIPHHSEAQRLPIDEAIKLVERVQASAERHAKLVLEAAATEISASILGIALRQCPDLPPTIAERITNYRASNVADWIMYRKAFAAAADARGWPVHWFDPKKVETLASKALASKALGVKNLDAHFAQLRRSLGPPWTQDHKMAMAAAIAILNVC
jgi:hypothetical protein